MSYLENRQFIYLLFLTSNRAIYVLKNKTLAKIAQNSKGLTK